MYLGAPLKVFIPVAVVCAALAAAVPNARAQGNYEIQVYGSETVAPRSTMLQISPVHTGLAEAPAQALGRLMDSIVRMKPEGA